MIGIKKTLFAAAIAISAISAHADNLADDLRNISLANINAIVILTSQDMMTSGSYHFKGGADLQLYNFPLYHQFNPFWEELNLFANGSIGYSKIERDLDTGFEPPDYMNYRTFPLRFGGGIRYTNRYDFTLLGGFNIIYSHIENDYDYNSEFSQDYIKPIFDNVFANKTSKSYTYEFFWRAGYYPHWNRWKPYVEITGTFFQSTAKISLKTISSFSSSSAGATLKAGFETPRFIHLYGTDLSTEFYVEKNSFAGDVRETLGFDEYGSAAMLAHLYLNDKLPLISRIDVSVEMLNGGGMEGYNIGLGAGFSF
jgi:hypothetical protein